MRLCCPVSNCQAENHMGAERCERCGIPLLGYTRLAIYPNILFNLGLSAARQGNMNRARDLFSAVVYWYPMDLEARNALALACFTLSDFEEARSQWGEVLEKKSTDLTAVKGLELLQNVSKIPSANAPKNRPKPSSKKKRKQKTSKKKR
ncbi:MAG: hypothetical protein GTO45_09795 [Candidatus Aminicenantes bacterium]|nr:hypothetical protein [Candidatus Aminicenantes bacterium]NIN18385.1 hypothetical protein [Candidatus Aminicenantes bacterium]NIN42273.1 hypothetical protein [Candidatus Aminicenantes bacterium]NIN85039.1 hypothetical protein [Candidatus Aminicenantes bacterium]NIO81250.1 hypothetical protein [Candidatus Aminicenantes bacterium]